jgi:antitoxin component YwqK of YwqJK toxin-antitoxin module
MKRVPHDSLDYPGDGYYYLDDEPFTGLGVSHYEDGSLKSEIEFKDGLKSGLERHWFASGKLHSEAEMRRSVVHGKERVWYSSGQLKEEGDYEHGVTLRRKEWDEDGDLVEEYELKETDSDYSLLLQLRDIDKRRSGAARRTN